MAVVPMSGKRKLAQRARVPETYSKFNVDLIAHRGNVEADWLRDAVVDQRFMYLNRESVDGWNAVIQCGEYATYEHCKGVLKQFLREQYWNDLIKSGKLGSVVMLGAGAPDKDIMIINSILKSGIYNIENRLKFVIFDSSFYMLIDTVQRIELLLKRKDAEDAVEVIPCCADFLKLRSWRACLRPAEDDRLAAFFILGGTIGNIEEVALIEAVKDVSSEGDIFTIAGELIDEYDSEQYYAQLLNTYNHDAARDLALGPVRALLDKRGFPAHSDERRKLVDVKIEEASRLPNRIRCSMPGSKAVTFRLNQPIDGVHLTLVASKRHREQSLKSTLLSHHFACLESHCVNSEEENYKYLVFCRRDNLSCLDDTEETKTFDPSASPETLIAEGEGSQIEFKSTLRFNLHTNEEDARIQLAALKTIAAFVNSEGGILIIGIDDKKNAIGIEADKFSTEDKMNLHLSNLISDRMGAEHMMFIRLQFCNYDNKRILIVECRKGQAPLYVKDSGVERFYIRTGAETRELSGSSMQQYLRLRFR